MRRFYCALFLVCGFASAAMAANTRTVPGAKKNPAPAPAAAGFSLADAVKESGYAAALDDLLKNSGGLPVWIHEVRNPKGNYVGTAVVRTTVGGTTYELFHACKTGECAVHQFEVMFAPKGAQAWGAVMEDGKSIYYLGLPNPAQQGALKTGLKP